MKTINYFLWVVVMIGVILLGMVINTSLLYSDTQDSLYQYLYDNNSIIANSLGEQMKAKMQPMEDFAKSLERMPSEAITPYLLEQKRLSLGLDDLMIFDISHNKIVNHSGDHLYGDYIQSKKDGLLKKSKIAVDEDKCLYLSSPVRHLGKVKLLLIGSKQLDELPIPSSTKTVTLLIHTESNVVMAMNKGDESTIQQHEIDKIIKAYENNDYKGLYNYKTCYAVVNRINGTDCASVSIMDYDDWMPLLLMHILNYGLLIVMVLVVLIFCIRQFKRETKKYEKLYFSDPVTHGLNRYGFIKQMHEMMSKSKYPNYYVVCLDISEFRYINECWGDKAGDKTLLFVYNMISESLSLDKEVVCRSNIDRFLLFLYATSQDEVSHRIHDLIDLINSRIHLSFLEYNLQFSIGVCPLYLVEDMTSAMNNAVFVARHATVKDSCVFYSQEMIEKKQTDIELNHIFYNSLNNHDFLVYLQPKVSESGECNAEALVRWLHPEKGLIPPNRFIPLFEQNGKIVDLDLYVFEETCRLVSRWIEEGTDVSSVSVNVSRYSIMDMGDNIYKRYKMIKDRYCIPDGLIEVELTETVLLSGNQIASVKRIIEDFKSCGMRVALDDFGFAYSSLGILRSLDVDTLKLDQSFIKDTTTKSEKIIKSVIQLAHNLGMEVVAEGVEEQTQVEMLYQSGCDFIQGYYFSKPLSIDEFEIWRHKFKSNR